MVTCANRLHQLLFITYGAAVVRPQTIGWRRMSLRALLFAALATIGAPPAVADADWAGAALAAKAPRPIEGGAVTAEDLLRLRDMGGLAVSPRGDLAAFSVRQAAVVSNDYAMRWFVLRMSPGSDPVAVDIDGGQPIPLRQSGLPQAFIPSEPAKWAPDGRAFAFRRAVGDAVELWVVDAESLRPRRLASGEANVEAFLWTQDGVLLWRTGLVPAVHRSAVDAEARTGWLLDDRMPLFAARTPSPTPPACGRRRVPSVCRVETFGLGAQGEARAATSAEEEFVDRYLGAQTPVSGPRTRKWGVISAEGDAGPIARTLASDPSRADSLIPIRYVTTEALGGRECRLPACAGQTIDAVGAGRAGSTVWFIKRERSDGPQIGAFDQTVVYEWSPIRDQVRQVLRTDARIEDCHALSDRLICVRSTSTRPSHIVAISLSTGRLAVLADPNPAFQTKTFPKVRKVGFLGIDGNPGYAHVVYPNDYRKGRSYPAVLVPYRSRGFLRGGTGDEVPIFPLAARGFVVISVDKPEFMREAAVMNRDAFETYGYADDFRDRRNTFEGDRRLLRRLQDEGLVDSRRVAITGLSAGSEMVHYALQRSDDFAAAIASQGANDATLLAMVPSGWARRLWMKMLNAETIVPRTGDPLLALAWSSMPERLQAPLLLNVGQNELMFGFEGVQALIDAERPVEVRVFPDETHVKFHPASYAGVYDNNIRWLQFWLQGVVDPDPAYSQVYARWTAMKARLKRETPPPLDRPAPAGSTARRSGSSQAP